MANDIAQRALTANKYEQKIYLINILNSINSQKGNKVLDFGCGTGLFATCFRKQKMAYYGYDVDKRLTSYASWLNKDFKFTASLDELMNVAPFNLILANCCFHHISDEDIVIELGRLEKLLSIDGYFVMIDILKVEDDKDPLHRFFMMLEKGHHVRTEIESALLIETTFDIVNRDHYRSHLLSIKGFPLYNDVAILTCKRRSR